MSVKLGRVIFKRINGRIVPIRIGAEAKTLAAGLSGVSASTLRKVDFIKNSKNLAKINEFVKNSVVKNKVFHGTNENFAKFLHDKIGSANGTSVGRGFYFSPQKEVAAMYGKKIKEVYLNIKKPAVVDLNESVLTKKLNKTQIQKLIQMHKDPNKLSNFGDVNYEGHKNVLRRAVDSLHKYNDDHLNQINDISQSVYNNNLKDFFENLRKVTGYDGVVATNSKHSQIIAYNSDQIMKSPKVSRLYKAFRGKK